MAIENLFDITMHRDQLSHFGVKIEVKGKKTFVTAPGCDQPIELVDGQRLHVGLANASQSTFRHTATQWGSPVKEITSAARAGKRIPVKPARRDSDVPYDTPSLDTAFHDHEMDV